MSSKKENAKLFLMAIATVLILCAVLYGFVKDLKNGNIGGSGVDSKAVEETVKNYLNEHPEVIIEALQNHQKKQQNDMQKNAETGIKDHYNEIINDGFSGVAGNPNGDVTVVEFFDYACPYCKRMVPTIGKLLAQDKGVRFVFKEFPILSANSAVAAKAALAVNEIAPDKYFAFHNKLMESHFSGKDSILKIAKDLGIDSDAVAKKMDDKAISDMIEKNRTLASQIGVGGTPGFVIGQKLIPGAVGLDQLKAYIDDARKAAGNNAQAEKADSGKKDDNNADSHGE